MAVTTPALGKTPVVVAEPSNKILYVGVAAGVDPDLVNRVAVACSVWNTALTRPVLILATTPQPPRVDVWVTPVMGYPVPEMAALTCLGYEAKLVSFDTRMKRDAGFTRMLVHEFGHVLGLEHNPSKRSVMYYRLEGAGWPDSRDMTEVMKRWTP
jgi:hypothetical protein